MVLTLFQPLNVFESYFCLLLLRLKGCIRVVKSLKTQRKETQGRRSGVQTPSYTAVRAKSKTAKVGVSEQQSIISNAASEDAGAALLDRLLRTAPLEVAVD